MKDVLRYLKPYRLQMLGGFLIKILGTVAELFMPWILAYILDDVVPAVKGNRQYYQLALWGTMMLVLAVCARVFNVFANRKAAEVAKNTIGALRYDLFRKIMTLSGRQSDSFGIPSLISRMTSDSYNIHSAINVLQRMGVRAPMIILGGLFITATLEPVLTLVLAATLPFIVFIVYSVSHKGIPLYEKVQAAVDGMVRTLREDVAGIRVIKALSKTEYEKERFRHANEGVVEKELKASGVMATSGPLLNLCLNLGLTAVIVVGAYRVNAGASQPGKIVAFLTYFTMILNAVIAVNRIFMVYSKASASAARISLVLNAGEDLPVLVEDEAEKMAKTPETQGIQEMPGTMLADSCLKSTACNVQNESEELTPKGNAPKIEFCDVSFGYQGGKDKYCLEHISFKLMPGETLGIIGATGSGKTTLFSLLMRFYDVSEGEIRIDGKDIRSYPLQELRRKFGAVFQNDVIFADTVKENISFGRGLAPEVLEEAAGRAKATDFIAEKDGGMEHVAAIKGADFSGGQKQRLFVARALAGTPEILLLDDASSALDYKTDAFIRRQIRENYAGTTTLVIAQRVSSIMHSTLILVLDDGRIIGAGSHEELLASCEVYREIAQTQLNE